MNTGYRQFTIVQEGKPAGPFSIGELYRMLAKGKINEATICAEQGREQWGTVEDLAADFAIHEQVQARPLTRLGVTVEAAASDQPVIPLAGSPVREWSGLLVLGGFMILAGFVAMSSFFFMSVDVPAGDILQRVSNLGLMNTRVCGMIASVGLTLLGGLLLVVDAIKTRQ